MQGLDFGYTNHPSAFHQSYVDLENKKIFIYDGFYEKGMSNAKIAQSIIDMLGHKITTVADSAEPKSIDYTKGRWVKGAKDS